MLLNGRGCPNNDAIKTFEYRNAFDIVGWGKVCCCPPAFNFVYAARSHHHRMLNLKMWSNLVFFVPQRRHGNWSRCNLSGKHIPWIRSCRSKLALISEGCEYRGSQKSHSWSSLHYFVAFCVWSVWNLFHSCMLNMPLISKGVVTGGGNFKFWSKLRFLHGKMRFGRENHAIQYAQFPLDGKGWRSQQNCKKMGCAPGWPVSCAVTQWCLWFLVWIALHSVICGVCCCVQCSNAISHWGPFFTDAREFAYMY